MLCPRVGALTRHTQLGEYLRKISPTNIHANDLYHGMTFANERRRSRGCFCAAS